MWIFNSLFKKVERIEYWLLSIVITFFNFLLKLIKSCQNPIFSTNIWSEHEWQKWKTENGVHRHILNGPVFYLLYLLIKFIRKWLFTVTL